MLPHTPSACHHWSWQEPNPQLLSGHLQPASPPHRQEKIQSIRALKSHLQGLGSQGPGAGTGCGVRTSLAEQLTKGKGEKENHTGCQTPSLGRAGPGRSPGLSAASAEHGRTGSCAASRTALPPPPPPRPPPATGAPCHPAGSTPVGGHVPLRRGHFSKSAAGRALGPGQRGPSLRHLRASGAPPPPAAPPVSRSFSLGPPASLRAEAGRED